MQHELVAGHQLSGFLVDQNNQGKVEDNLAASDRRVEPDQPVAGQSQLAVDVGSLDQKSVERCLLQNKFYRITKA